MRASSPRLPQSVSLFHGLLLPVVVSTVSPLACQCTSQSSTSHLLTTDSAAMTPDRATPSKELLECPKLLASTRNGGMQAGAYQVPPVNDRSAARAAFHSLLNGSTPDVRSFGFEIVPIPEWPGTVLVRERPDHTRGGGAYVVRTGSTSTFVVQAPHTFFDEGTLPLACDMFQRTEARALFINTTHRYKSAPEPRADEHPADVAHAPDSLFLAMTEGLVEAIPKVDVIQLHGFQNRETTARAVLSSGERRPGVPIVLRARAAFEAVVGPRVIVYPEDTSELGATTNVEGMAVRHSGGRFLHVEMDGDLRRALGADALLRGRALDALAAAFH